MKRSDLTELDGVAWCLEHDNVWFEGEVWCREWPMSSASCIEAPLFHGPAITADTP